MNTQGFNSSVGILVVRTTRIIPRLVARPLTFQFLGRNSGRSDFVLSIDSTWRIEFQFLGRNSGRSDRSGCYRSFAESPRFQFLGRNSGRSDLIVFNPLGEAWEKVSIPRSEFWSFGRISGKWWISLRDRFQFLGRNSGRSDFGTLRTSTARTSMFQFLGRNSGRSDDIPRAAAAGRLQVSIPRSEFWSFGRAQRHCIEARVMKFQFLGRNSGRSDGPGLAFMLPDGLRFQFLGRNSGRSDLTCSTSIPGATSVSIPRSEFWSFGLA